MAAEKIKHSDLIEDKIFDPTIKSGEEMLGVIIKLKSGFQDILKTSKEFLKQPTVPTTKGLEDTAKKLKSVDEATKGLLETEKAALKVSEQLKQRTDEEVKAKIRYQRANQEQNFILKQQVIIQKEAVGSVNRLRAELALVTNAWNKSTEAQRGDAAITGTLSKQKLDLTNQLKAVELATGDARRNVGNYTESIKEALGESNLFGQATKTLNEIATITNGIYGALKTAQEKVTSAFGFGKKATEEKIIVDKENIIVTNAETIADEKNTVAEEINIVATKEATITTEGNIVAIETQTVATEAATKATGGFTKALNFLKKNPIIAVIAAIVALVVWMKEAAEENQNFVDEVERSEAVLKATALGAIGAAEAMGKYKDALFASREILRFLHERMQEFALDEQDQQEIMSDGTIGFQERNEALQKMIVLSNKRALAGVEIAKVEKDVADKEFATAKLMANGGRVLEEITNRRFEAAEKLKVAEDALGDLVRVNAEKQRQLNIDRTIADVDLLLKKKQSAFAEKTILENQLADEKIQLEQRKEIAKELLKVNKETTAEQISIVKKGFNIQFDEAALIGEQDAILLKEKLDGLTKVIEGGQIVHLADSEKVELSKIIKQAQENEIENNKTLVKLAEETLKRKIKIAEIEREILRIQNEDVVNDLQIQLAEKQKAFDKSNSDLLKGNESVDSELRAIRDKDFQDNIDLINKIALEKEKLLNDNANNEIIKNKSSILDDKIRAEEKKKIETKLQIDIENLRAETLKRGKDFIDKDIEDLKKANTEKVKVIQAIEDEQLKGQIEALGRRIENEKSAKKTNIKELSKIIDEQTDLQRRLLIDDADFKIQTEQHTAEEILLIQEKLKNDLARLDADAFKRKEDLLKSERIAENEANLKTIDLIQKAIFEGLKQRSEKKQLAIQSEQDANEKSITRQEELASKGLDNQLAFEEAKKSKLALKLKQEKEKEREREEVAQLVSAYLEFLKERAKENPNTAPARALSDTLIAKGVTKVISGLYEGSDSVGEQHAVGVLNQPKDNLLVPLHKGERVVGYEDSQKIKGMTNKEVVRAAELYKQGFFMPEVQDISKASQVDNAMAVMLSKKISELNTTLKNKREYNVDWNSHGERVEQVVENGMRLVIRKVTTGKARI